ncbi:hypothetical protein SprV_0200826100 [Sparganum proliferum]
MGLVGHLQTNCSTRTAPTVVFPSTSPSPPTPSSNVDPSSSPSSSPSASTSAAVASAMPINTTHNPDASNNTNTTAVNTSDEYLVYTCPHIDRTFTHTSAWSATCESIVQRLTNQCLDHQLTLAASASAVHMALSHSCTAWVY